MAWVQQPTPKNGLGYHRILSPTAGVRVSPLCLGTMNFGEAWESFMGECSKETTFQILDYFYENGGNFIDTSNNYQKEESEEWIGEWLEKRGARDQIVLATKFTSPWPKNQPESGIYANYSGNHAKSLHISVKASLKKLKTDYIDILYLHWWDFTTSIPELMQSLHHLVAAGKVLYLGISDTPAWIVSKANEYARNHGMTQFSVYQGHWSVVMRDFEREILPMCEAEGMGIAPWGTLGRGKLKSKAEFESRDGGRSGPQTERQLAVAAVCEKLAKAKNAEITSIALAYVMQKAPYVFPIVGGRKLEHLKGNVAGLDVELSQAEIDEIDGAAPFDHGFPLGFLYPGGYKHGMGSAKTLATSYAMHLKEPTKVQPIKPSTHGIVPNSSS